MSQRGHTSCTMESESESDKNESEDASENFISRDGTTGVLLHSGMRPEFFCASLGFKFLTKQKIYLKFAAWNLFLRNFMLDDILCFIIERCCVLIPTVRKNRCHLSDCCIFEEPSVGKFQTYGVMNLARIVFEKQCQGIIFNSSCGACGLVISTL